MVHFSKIEHKPTYFRFRSSISTSCRHIKAKLTTKSHQHQTPHLLILVLHVPFCRLLLVAQTAVLSSLTNSLPYRMFVIEIVWGINNSGEKNLQRRSAWEGYLWFDGAMNGRWGGWTRDVLSENWRKLEVLSNVTNFYYPETIRLIVWRILVSWFYLLFNHMYFLNMCIYWWLKVHAGDICPFHWPH